MTITLVQASCRKCLFWTYRITANKEDIFKEIEAHEHGDLLDWTVTYTPISHEQIGGFGIIG